MRGISAYIEFWAIIVLIAYLLVLTVVGWYVVSVGRDKASNDSDVEGG